MRTTRARQPAEPPAGGAPLAQVGSFLGHPPSLNTVEKASVWIVEPFLPWRSFDVVFSANRIVPGRRSVVAAGRGRHEPRTGRGPSGARQVENARGRLPLVRLRPYLRGPHEAHYLRGSP